MPQFWMRKPVLLGIVCWNIGCLRHKIARTLLPLASRNWRFV